MRHEDRGQLARLEYLLQIALNLAPGSAIERRQGFVEEEHMRTNEQRPRQRNALPLPTRKRRNPRLF